MFPQIDGSKRDAARVVSENNQLHVQLIHEAEKFDAQQTQHYKRVKELENEIAELSFWKHQALNRFEGSEKEIASLKERLQELLKLGAVSLPCHPTFNAHQNAQLHF
jgi:centrosomal protein CEP135